MSALVCSREPESADPLELLDREGRTPPALRPVAGEVVARGSKWLLFGAAAAGEGPQSR